MRAAASCSLIDYLIEANLSRVSFAGQHNVTAVPLSHYANGFSHSPYGNSCIEANPQPEITPNSSFDENFPAHYAIDGNGSYG